MSNLLLCSHLKSCLRLRVRFRPLTFNEQKEAVKGVVISYSKSFVLFCFCFFAYFRKLCSM